MRASSTARSPFDTRIKSTIVSAVGAMERAQMLTRDTVMLRETTDALIARAHLLVAQCRRLWWEDGGTVDSRRPGR